LKNLRVSACRWFCVALLCVGFAQAQEITLTARVELIEGNKPAKPPDAENVVVWLVPEGGAAGPAAFHQNHIAPAQVPRLVQHNKTFEPHVLVVPVGSVVAFPNRDPFFHNVFSLFEGKRFDLGLYEAGTTRDVHFDKPGISYIFCNIHPEMSAVVIALDTPYYGISDSRGQVVIANVPSGKYTLRVWYEATPPETLKAMTREVTVSEASSTLGVLRLTEATLSTAHKNLYGRDYDSPAPDSPAYERH
jgi:plastocyanin